MSSSRLIAGNLHKPFSDSLQRNYTKEKSTNTMETGTVKWFNDAKLRFHSAASPAMMFSCISQPFRQAVSAACKKVKPFNLTSPRDRRAGRRKTFERHRFQNRKEAILNNNRLFSLSEIRLSSNVTPRLDCKCRLPCDAPSHTC